MGKKQNTDIKNLEKKVEAVLKKIPDPELDVSIWDMGLIYDVKVGEKFDVSIKMTLTSFGCPLFSIMEDAIKKEVKHVKGVKSVSVELVFDPPWSMDRMSRTAKAKLGFL